MSTKPKEHNMADANEAANNVAVDERTLVMKQETGEDLTYMVNDFTVEAKMLYAKIEILSKESQNIKVNAEFNLEKNQILQSHYLEALKPSLEDLQPLIATSDEAEIVEEVEYEQDTDEEADKS
jgi:hypothetical protein|tara:strand:+ start:1453 stop:1824 length:372 start_codon:yes stop_codon:yes gene_type:complete